MTACCYEMFCVNYFTRAICIEVNEMQISEAAGGSPALGAEPCRFPKLEECAHFHYERVHLPQLRISLQTNMDQSLHSQHTNEEDEAEWFLIQVTSGDECWLLQRNFENFKLLDAQLHQCIYDRKISQLKDLHNHSQEDVDIEVKLMGYLERFTEIADNSLNCGPVLNWLQMDNKGHRLLVPSEESRSINTPAVAAAYSVRRYVSQARDELNLEVGDMISVIDMASPGESMWWRGKRGFQVGFFPQHCVHIIGDKVPRNMPLPPPVVGSLALTPIKPVLRKHGKLITFFRSFILNRPSRRRLKQSGILRERVFACDLGEHLLNSGHDIPMVLKCCAEFIEKNGIVDGIYRLSGVTSNIQKLRNAFDEDRIPNLYTEDILQDIHSVASLLKMYFRELPNPLCTYQLYQSFVNAVQGGGARHMEGDHERLLRMREAVQKLPPPHYRTLEYLMRHLAKVAKHGPNTGMTTRNIAIVWAPNLLRCAELEDGGVTALQGVGVQAVVTEFLICFSDLIFCDRLPNLDKPLLESSMSPKKCRPKSLAISTPTKLITLEEAQSKQLNRSEECNYIEVGGGPKNLPKKYHTIIELPSGIRKRGLTKRSPSSGWRSFFTKSRNSSQGNLNKNRKSSVPGISVSEKSITESDLSDMRKKLRSVKSAESLTSGHSEPTTNEIDILGPLHSLHKPPGHNRSVSHDSYFDTLQTSRNNSEASLLDLSEIQLNFDLEETEMRIFSEDESLVSSPKVHGDGNQRRVLTRARPEEFSSTTNSGNPSPKKQARVVMSPDSMSRKRTRLEDQLSDIQYIDCNTPDNVVSTTVLVHTYPENGTVSPEIVSNRSYESYRPKNKSPRNSDILDTNKRKSLNLKLEQNAGKQSIVKSFTETDVARRKADTYSVFGTPSPQSPRYRHLGESSANTTPGISPDSTEVTYEQLGRNDATKNPTTPTYENVLTTISIIYKSPPRSVNSSPLKSPVADPDGAYENVIFNPEKALIPTSTASLPTQQASQPELCNQNETLPIDEREQRPKSLSALEDNNNKESTTLYRPNLSSSAVYDTNEQISLLNSADSKTLSSNRSSGSNIQYTASSNSPPYRFIDNGEQTGSPTDLSLSEVLHSSTENLSTSHTSLSFPASPSKNSPSPNVSPTHLGDSKSQTPNSLLNTKNTSECSLLQDASYSEDCKVKENAARPISFNLIDFSPVVENDRSVTSPTSERHRSSPTKIVSNDKRKSSETENNDDINIYQQVKYFRRSIHEVNALLDYPSLEQCENSVISTSNEATKPDDSFKDETYDSLEPDDAHVYENIEGEAMRTDCSYDPVRNGVKEDEAIEEESPKKKSTDSAMSAGVLKNISPNSEDGKLFTNQSVHKSPKKSNDTTPITIERNSIDAAISEDVITTEDSATVDDSRRIDPMPKLSPKGSAIFEDGIALRSPKNSKDAPATFENRIELRSQKGSKDSALFEAISALKSSRNSKDSEDKISVKDLLVKFEDNKDWMTYSLPSNTRNSIENVQQKNASEPTNVRLRKFYEKDSLPPCLRARNLKNQIKTRSLDEEEFKKEFGLSPSRRKSLDESANYKTNSLPKMLNPPKGLPLDEDDEINSIHMAHSTENLSLLPEEERKKRERIEKYKEERRKILQEKFRSESFKEGKDVILSRLKIASKPTIECEADESSRYEKTRRKNSKRLETEEVAPPPPKQSPVVVVAAPAIAGKPPAGDLKSDSLKARAAMFEQRKMLSPSKLPQPCKVPPATAKQTRCVTENNKADFIRNKIDDVGVQMLKNERRRHTFDSRDRELEAERSRRVSVENRSPRKEKAAPSPYCIKDMKAIFESKSKQ